MDDYFGYFCYFELIILVLCLVSSFLSVEGILVIIDILCVFFMVLKIGPDRPVQPGTGPLSGPVL